MPSSVQVSIGVLIVSMVGPDDVIKVGCDGGQNAGLEREVGDGQLLLTDMDIKSRDQTNQISPLLRNAPLILRINSPSRMRKNIRMIT